MNTAKLLEIMETCNDPLDPDIERMFKNNPPAMSEDPEVAARYWTMYMNTYGTPNSHMSVRSMFYNYNFLFNTTRP
jgi:hypothetical protein